MSPAPTTEREEEQYIRITVEAVRYGRASDNVKFIDEVTRELELRFGSAILGVQGEWPE